MGIASSFSKDSCLDKYEYYNHYLLHTVRQNGHFELASTVQLTNPGITAIIDTFPINPNTEMVRLRRQDGTLHIASMKQVLDGIEPVTLGTPDPGSGSFKVFESCQSKFKFYVTDHLGNTRIVYGAEAVCGQGAAKLTLTSMTDYSPYGNVLQRKSFMKMATRFMTTFHERDSATMIDYRNARFSDAEVGGFLSVDPLAGERPGHSPYNYCSGNPIMRTDPTGMIDDWYQNNETNEVEWHEGSGAKEGYTYLGKEGYVDMEIIQVWHSMVMLMEQNHIMVRQN